MKLRRGDIVTAAFPGDLKKPRPAVIIQADEFIDQHRTVLACPFSSYLADAPLFRPTVEPTLENGLELRSQVMVDKITPAKKSAIGQVIGHIGASDLARVEAALVNIAGLRTSIVPIASVAP